MHHKILNMADIRRYSDVAMHIKWARHVILAGIAKRIGHYDGCPIPSPRGSRRLCKTRPTGAAAAGRDDTRKRKEDADAASSTRIGARNIAGYWCQRHLSAGLSSLKRFPVIARSRRRRSNLHDLAT